MTSVFIKNQVARLVRKDRIDSLLITIDKTIQHLKKGDVMLSHEELYEGLPKEKAEGWRREAREKWGNDAVERSEMQLLTMTREDLTGLKTAFASNWQRLGVLSQSSDPTSPEVQEAVRLHYQHIRQFWGTAGQPDQQWKAYKCLGEMYTQDHRFTAIDGEPNPQFAEFLCKAINHFVEGQD